MPTPIRDVAEGLLPRVDEMTEAMVEGYRQRIPDYPKLLKRHSEDVYAVSRNALLIFLQLVIENRQATDQELAVIRKAGRARAGQGLTLESTLQAYSIGREIAWQFISEAAEKAGVEEEEFSEVTILMARFMEKLALRVTQGFLDHMKHAYEGEQHRMAVLIDIAKAMSRSLDLDEVVGVGLERLREALDVDWAGLWLISVEKGRLRLAGQQVVPDWEQASIGDLFPDVGLDQPIIGADTMAGQPVVYGEEDLPSEISASGARMLMIVPLLHRERPLGAIAVATREPGDMTVRDRHFLIAIAEQMAVAIHTVQEHMREARTDFLTGLANRHEFDSFLRRELARAERFGDALSLAMIDLDGLKVINDHHGHRAGDEALRIVGTTLKATVRLLDLAARIGGDEFALVMPQTDASGARDVVARFQQHLAENGKGLELPPVSVSAGIAEWEEGISFDSFTAAADAELYEAKHARASAAPAP